MEKYPKLFIKASIIYLFLGVVIGLIFSLFPDTRVNNLFIHAHLNLFGFLSMMIFGVAYHILPRFNAKPVKYQVLIPAHFYLQNIGLIGMVLSFFLVNSMEWDIWNPIFHLSSGISTLSVLIFVFNIFPVLKENKVPVSTVEIKDDIIQGDVNVGALLEQFPEILSLFVESGFKELENPAARASFAKKITISRACKIHKVDPDTFLMKVNTFLKGRSGLEALSGLSESTPEMATPKISGETPEHPSPPSTATTISKGEKCSGSTLIGDVISVYPETKKVIEKHYGAGCFSCPGQASETIEQSALMHGIDLKMIVDELNGAIEKNGV